MLNNVSGTRLSRDDRRRQLIAVGLQKLTEKPAHALSIDEVAESAGISRGLLFHYFPSKGAYFGALAEAAGRRVLHNTEPDPDAGPTDQVGQMALRLIEQIDRRRESYVAFMRGFGGNDTELSRVHAQIWGTLTDRVLTARPSLDGDVVDAWWSYVEARALSWSIRPASQRSMSSAELADHCVLALDALAALPTHR